MTQKNTSVVYSQAHGNPDANMNHGIICYPPLLVDDAGDEIHTPLQRYCKIATQDTEPLNYLQRRDEGIHREKS